MSERSKNHGWVRCLVTVCVVLAGRPVQADRPNVVIFVADDLGWADVGYHNPEMRTPNLDALVKTGVELDRHYVMPMCTPTRVALMTGRYPSRFGTHCTQASNKRALPMGTPTLASMFQAAGYDTALIGKWHLGSKPEWGPIHYGFAYSFGSLAGAVGPYDHRYRLTRPEFTRTFHRDHEFIEEAGHMTDLTAEEAGRWIERERDVPFFLYVPFHAVHIPLVEEQQWQDKNAHIDSPDRRLFAAATTHMDQAIGQVVAALDRSGTRENTFILFFSDNGALRNHVGGKYPPPDPALSNFSSNAPLRGHKTEAYEGGIRVPAVVNWPAELSPRVVETPLHAVDWYPTLARLIQPQESAEPNWDGVDVWNILTGETNQLAPRNLYWVTGERRKWVAVLRDDWKIVRRENNDWELFHLASDPNETKNLALDYPERLRCLIQQYECEWASDGGTETLFDGVSLEGWTTADGEPVTSPGWSVVDGMISFKPVKPRPGHIMTERPFKNFRLSFEWKIAPGGNGGLKYRVRDYSGKWRGCEYQILDDAGYKKPMPPVNTTGALYDLYPPNNKKQLNPPGEFNSSTIVVQDDHIEHWLNGQRILVARVGDDTWRQRVAVSKFNELPEFGENPIGQIMLTDHHSESWYRKFKFEPLPSEIN